VALSTVSNYASAARIILQDETVPYRFSDAKLALALSAGLGEARRLRPDLFLGVTSVPTYTIVDSTVVTLDERYRMALVYYLCGWVQLTDDETTQDSRAVFFLNKFTSELVSGA
jgi:hypothetical protein